MVKIIYINKNNKKTKGVLKTKYNNGYLVDIGNNNVEFVPKKVVIEYINLKKDGRR